MIYIAVVSFALGIACEEIFNFGWSAGALVFLISFFIFLYLKKEGLNFAKIFLIVGIAFCIGVLRMGFTDISPDQNLLSLVGENISFEGVVSEEADIRDTSVRYIVSVNQLADEATYADYCLARLNEAVLRRKNSAEFYPCNQQHVSRSERVLLVADRYPELSYGDRVSVSGRLDLPKNFESDNGTEFDYISYLSKDNVHFIIYYPQIDLASSSVTELRGTAKTVSALYGLKNILIEKISAVVPEPNASLLGGVIFGVKQSLGPELLDDFRKVGLIHIVVLSGYNITVIAAGIFFLTSRFGKRNFGFIISVVCIALFAVMVGLGATVVRASIMALIAILARFLGRPADAMRWLFIAGALMLFYNPLSLLRDPSFQLSFMATFGLILFSPFVYGFISKRKVLSKIILEKLALREIVASTVAVQIFILPLLIRMSGEVSLVSFIINPIALPFVPFAMGFGALTGAVGLLPFIGQILSWPFGTISYLITQFMIFITEFASSLPIAAIKLSALPFAGILIWYGFYVWVYFRLRKSSLIETT